MKLSELNELYITEKYLFKQSKDYVFGGNKDIELPEDITDFIRKLNNNEIIRKEEFQSFSESLLQLNKDVQDCIIFLLYYMTDPVFDIHYKDDITEAVNSIESSLNARREIPQSSGDDAEKYIRLVNYYYLFSHYRPKSNDYYGYAYPGTNSWDTNVRYNLPFAINALRLVGKLPTTPDFNGIDLSKPYFPLHLQVVKKEKVTIRKGIPDSEKFYPYKMVAKLFKGNTGDNTFLATNGKKKIFIRGVEDYAPHAVLASKIASIISPTHFSIERLLNNRLVGARGIPGYARSAADDETRDARKKYIDKNKRIFPGTGIIDEVTNFVGESDPNIENYGFSSEDIDNSHLSKIDFDRCDVDSEIPKELYERNILTKPRRGLYHGATHVQTNPEYIKEKLYARLKLSMLTEPLFSKLANKAFAAEDHELQKKAIKELTNRSNIALELFFEHPDVKSFLTQNPSTLSQCYSEITNYISTHFVEQDRELIQHSLAKRVGNIHEEIKKTLDINLPLSMDKKNSFAELNPKDKASEEPHQEEAHKEQQRLQEQQEKQRQEEARKEQQRLQEQQEKQRQEEARKEQQRLQEQQEKQRQEEARKEQQRLQEQQEKQRQEEARKEQQRLQEQQEKQRQEEARKEQQRLQEQQEKQRQEEARKEQQRLQEQQEKQRQEEARKEQQRLQEQQEKQRQEEARKEQQRLQEQQEKQRQEEARKEQQRLQEQQEKQRQEEARKEQQRLQEQQEKQRQEEARKEQQRLQEQQEKQRQEEARKEQQSLQEQQEKQRQEEARKEQQRLQEQQEKQRQEEARKEQQRLQEQQEKQRQEEARKEQQRLQEQQEKQRQEEARKEQQRLQEQQEKQRQEEARKEQQRLQEQQEKQRQEEARKEQQRLQEQQEKQRQEEARKEQQRLQEQQEKQRQEEARKEQQRLQEQQEKQRQEEARKEQQRLQEQQEKQRQEEARKEQQRLQEQQEKQRQEEARKEQQRLQEQQEKQRQEEARKEQQRLQEQQEKQRQEEARKEQQRLQEQQEKQRQEEARKEQQRLQEQQEKQRQEEARKEQQRLQEQQEKQRQEEARIEQRSMKDQLKKQRQVEACKEQPDPEQTICNEYHRDFNKAIDVLKQKMEEFKRDPDFEKNPKLQEAHKAANKLYNKLERTGNSYFTKEPSQEEYDNFKLCCKTHIDEARSVLNEHRGWKKILINVVAIIVTAGIGYAIAAGINIAMNKGKFTFFATDSSEKLDVIEEHIKNKVGK
ncbi:hypothetical protein [Legionella fallonii]|uniref:Elongation factor 1 beta central acidic region eukaryote domain-containing protein n=1 Tax=Legionella fallonii LLAP-10 TaxID=1212491 RepID=A0A098G521_9GAMM|nr:hypothetical protein [Legionella fallonii]CEG57061.1 protein of unknown function [Legionella fallonii LLAP-10]